jgi:hypothetical protein
MVLDMKIGPSHGFVCLFCGSRTLLPASRNARRSSGDSAALRSLVSLLRCRSCGKEAPYGPREIIDIQDVA